jgi:FkbM family methyltransferase
MKGINYLLEQNFYELIETRDVDINDTENPSVQAQFKMYWPKGDDGGWTGPWEDWLQHHSKKYFTRLKQYNTCITVGANCGIHTYYYARLFGRVYAFEPSPLNFFCLNLNTPFANVVKFPIAIGNKDEFVGMDTSATANIGTHMVRDDTGAYPPIYPMFKLDSFKFRSCDFLQMDIEGHEYQALLGAENLIMTFRPIVVVERNNHAQDAADLLSKGYNYHHYETSASDSVWIPQETMD